MTKITFLVPSICLAMTGCTPISSQKQKLEQDTRKERFDRFLDDYLAAFNSGDARRLGSFFREDTIHLPPTGPELAGRAAVESYYEDFCSQFTPQMTLYVPEYQLIEDWVFVREKWEMRVEPLASDAVVIK